MVEEDGGEEEVGAGCVGYLVEEEAVDLEVRVEVRVGGEGEVVFGRGQGGEEGEDDEGEEEEGGGGGGGEARGLHGVGLSRERVAGGGGGAGGGIGERIQDQRLCFVCEGGVAIVCLLLVGSEVRRSPTSQYPKYCQVEKNQPWAHPRSRPRVILTGVRPRGL